MIHTKETIEQIRELLISSGVPVGEVLEEMVDHYLSDIESQVNLQKSPLTAIDLTCQKIKKADFSNLNQKKKQGYFLVLIAAILLLSSSIAYQRFFHTEKEKSIVSSSEVATNEEMAPDGWPLHRTITTITSHFGPRIHPVSKSFKLHKGVDIRAENGTPVFATEGAVVLETGFKNKAGKYIILKHNDRYSSRYYHLSSIDVQENDIVAKGSLIGRVGNTGLSFGPHLHYEILEGETPRDPLDFIRP